MVYHVEQIELLKNGDDYCRCVCDRDPYGLSGLILGDWSHHWVEMMVHQKRATEMILVVVYIRLWPQRRGRLGNTC